MSLRAYARRKGVAPSAVVNAVRRERLVKSVVYVKGQPKIADADLADAEWRQNTDLSRAPGFVKEREFEAAVFVQARGRHTLSVFADSESRQICAALRDGERGLVLLAINDEELLPMTPELAADLGVMLLRVAGCALRTGTSSIFEGGSDDGTDSRNAGGR